MTEEAAAVAVEETPAVETSEVAPSEVDERAEMARIFRESQSEDAEDHPAPEPEAPAEPEAEEKPAETLEEITVPSYLPEGVRSVWKDVPEGARAALDRSYREMGDKLANQGRIVTGIKPIHDAVVRAAQEIPTLGEMTPAQIANDVFEMARIQGQFRQDPVRTLMGIAEQHGALDALKAALSGEQAPAQQDMALVQEVRNLREQLARVSDPAAIDQRIQTTLSQQATEREVTEFAKAQEHWGAVEQSIPAMIPVAKAKLGESASAKDVLALAYDMAVHADPDLRAKVRTAVEETPEPDPQKAADAAKAASINVSTRGTGKQAQVSETEMLRQAYRAAQRG